MVIKDSGKVGIGETTPLGKLHIKEADSGASSAPSNSDTLVLEGSSEIGISMLTGSTNKMSIHFGDSSNVEVGGIVYHNNGDTMRFNTFGAERMRITSTGVGFGTSTIARQLVVSGVVSPVISIRDTGTSGSPSLFFGDSDADNVGKIQYNNSNNSLATVVNGSERMRIAAGGNVSFGTTQDQSKVQITTASSGVSVNSNADELFVEGSGNSGITIGSGTSGAGQLAFGDSGDNDTGAIAYLHDVNAMRFTTSGNEAMRIHSNGKISMGTTSSGANLEIKATKRTTGQDLESGGISLRNTGSVAGGNILPITARLVDGANARAGIGFVAQTQDGGNAGYAGEIAFYTMGSADGASLTNSFERVRINKSGNFGIGTSTPGSPLTVSGGTNSTVANLNNNVSSLTSMSNVLLLQSNTTGSSGVGTGLNIAFNGERNDGNTQRFGNLGFSANTNSGASLKTDMVISLYSGHEVLRLKQHTVNGSDAEMIAPSLKTTGTTSNRYPLYWVHNGTIGSIQPYTGSVREMKTDINDMSSVNWIHSLRPRSFKFRDFETNEDGSKTYLETTDNEPSTEYGLIAEEVNEVNGSDYILDKETDEDGNEKLKGVLYHNLVPVLLKAVQEQKNTIQELEARIKVLEDE